MRWTLAAVLMAVTFGVRAAALTQDSPPKRLAFDVASVKESESLELDGVFRTGPGRFTVTNLSARWILRYAFRLRDYQVIDAPSWTETRYQVEATFSDAGASDDEVRGMVQRLLIDRFALRARIEQRNIAVYSLEKARANGALGPKLTPSSVDCHKPAADGGRRYCLFQTAWSIRGFTSTMPQLAQLLDGAVASPVVDRTGLVGGFDFDLHWGTPEGNALRDPSQLTPEETAALFTALREQLGLKLEPTRAPYDVLVIDSMSRPTPN
jgi:uncharacterized protein (TIGR03435 family)